MSISTSTAARADMGLRAIRALQATWSAIAYDALELTDDKTMTKAEVIEMVTTCGYGSGSYPASYGGDPEAVKWLDRLPDAEQDKILQDAFPAPIYGY